MASLVEIVVSEEKRKGIVLFDSSIHLDSFGQSIYNAKRYADLDADLLDKAQNSTEKFLEFIHKKNTFTFESVHKDIIKLYKIAAEEQDFLNTFQKTVPQDTDYVGQYNPLLFKNILKNLFDILFVFRNKIFIVKDQKVYGKLIDAVNYILSTAYASQEFSEKQRQFYATALYLSLHQGTPSTLVLKKSTKFKDGLELLTEKFKREVPQGLQSSNLQQYPINLYFGTNNEGFKLVYSTQNEKPTQRINP